MANIPHAIEGDESEPLLVTSPIWRVNEEMAVSHLPILPPIWISLPTDTALYPRPPPILFKPLLPLFQLDSTSSCPCTGFHRTFYIKGNATINRMGTLYTSCGSFPCNVELQPCPECPASRKQFIGPDLREHGIFNYSNSTFVSHELLDEYTSSFTLSETPFDAWKFDDDFECPECGKYPDNVIWDGVTLAFHRRQLLSSIHPPTSVSNSSEERPTKYLPGQQILPFPLLCKSLRAISAPDGSRTQPIGSATSNTVDITAQLCAVSHPLATLFQVYFGPDRGNVPRAIRRFFFQVAAEESAIQMLNRPSQEALQSFVANPSAGSEQHLRGCLHIYDLLQFDRKRSVGEKYSAAVLAAVHWILRRSATVLLQLMRNSPLPKNWNDTASTIGASNWEDVAAEESAIQMLNRPSQEALQSFVANPSAGSEQHLRGCLHIYDLLQFDRKRSVGEKYSAAVLAAVHWILRRSATVLLQLMRNSPLPKNWNDTASTIGASNWEDSGCFYSMPQIRARPVYPLLAGDTAKDGQRGGKCSKSPQLSDPECGKYFATYGQKRLTGGIMVAWCTHSISYGFHCIPQSEGRNNVFSAMITHWPVAPKCIIYDFSCALAPYCILCKPHFFADTTFMIDKFHARDHTKCAPACFASAYAEFDPDVNIINTSAAECGNSLIARIRKSVSYMGQ
ncbi:hypothetical protein AGABI1DRAFT_94560 [Agaricus bisporus var. burnettii JB137-S8]|uniref:HMG domain-containing protein n=1 Tax=Agaricus bisporus var. burnettii (strain JB137-S8 / ATCC MYA-4627 / FGSC 10392) TaxID=597362 RepID=K5XMU9_AGABU|nr:uncharacterized protein AGABI1DRAFT_94560 [Agaricus bisporus var. burnettii JB137-S8]EKM75940.1 hypothetical protein AGABI1DRAFT_94560 [Agaricus bisporus var. burnettii JB137-S8]